MYEHEIKNMILIDVKKRCDKLCPGVPKLINLHEVHA